MSTLQRVAIVVRKLSGRGGMETVIRAVAAAAAHAPEPTQVEIWCLGVPLRTEWLDGLPHRVANIDQGTGRRFQLGAKRWLYTRALRQFLDQSPVSALLATDPVFVAAGLAARRGPTRPRVFSWPHFSLDRLANIAWLQGADGHLALSTQIAEQIRGLHPHAAPTVVGNPLPTESAALVPPPQGPARLLYVGRLQNHQKRVDLLLDALAPLRDRPWTLEVYGDGPDRAPLEAQADRLGMGGHVQWHGWRANPWSTVTEATALVLPSDFEGFGMVLLEALVRGIPVVATDCVAGPRDIVRSGANGWLVPPGDGPALRRALERFIATPDGHLATSADERQRDVIERFAPGVVWQRMREALTT